ncbi:TetR/AcrR family transcriptional regulator [Sanguibacter suarezii]|uniref:TetR/AcrR family transcriptional regulator n=1 Tax=Sanguibacter suarezii TaxID=60921 RepID=UPI000831D92B|nr:TetR/AcrR family transcriptional regulator [Sanguibacter suarezii]
MPKNERQAQILAIAQDLFATHGFHHISMDDIAARADVSKPILYRHFPSKLDLYLTVVDERGQALVDAVAHALEPVVGWGPETDEMPDGYAIIHAVVGAYIKFAEGSGAAASLLFESDVTRDPTVRDRVDAPNRRNAELIAQALVTITDLTPEQALTVARTSTAMAQVAASDAHQGTADLVAQFAWRGIHGMLRREDPPGPTAAL